MWIIFALIPPILNAIDSLGEKFLSEKHIENPIVIILNEGWIYGIFGIFIFLFHHINLLPFEEIIPLLFSGMVFVYYLIPYFKALQNEDSSRVIPLFQFIPILILLFSFIFLREIITRNQLLGFVITFVGAFLLTVEKGESKILKPRKAFWYMLLASFLYSLAPILFKYVVIQTDFWTAFFYQCVGGGLGALSLLIIPAYRKSWSGEGMHLPWTTWGIMSFNQTLAILAEMSSSFAFSLAPVALVSVITGTQSFFVLIFALILSLKFPHILSEDIRKNTLVVKSISIILIFAGLIFISV